MVLSCVVACACVACMYVRVCTLYVCVLYFVCVCVCINTRLDVPPGYIFSDCVFCNTCISWSALSYRSLSRLIALMRGTA